MSDSLTPVVATGFCRRRWLLQHRVDGRYLADLASERVLWTTDPDQAWSCLWPQRAGELVRRLADRLPPAERLQLVEARYTLRAQSRSGSWPSHG
jgi:hypothetical protein